MWKWLHTHRNVVPPEDDHPLTPSQHLEKLTVEHMSACRSDWNTPFEDTSVKAKVYVYVGAFCNEYC